MLNKAILIAEPNLEDAQMSIDNLKFTIQLQSLGSSSFGQLPHTSITKKNIDKENKLLHSNR